jgi:hypothetical protein
MARRFNFEAETATPKGKEAWYKKRQNVLPILAFIFFVIGPSVGSWWGMISPTPLFPWMRAWFQERGVSLSILLLSIGTILLLVDFVIELIVVKQKLYLRPWVYVFGLLIFSFGLAVTNIKNRADRPKLPPGIDPSTENLPIATYSDMQKDTIVGKAVVINEVPHDPKHTQRIVEKTFIGCDIIGPQVIIPTGDFRFMEDQFESPKKLNPDIESILLETKSDTSWGMLEVHSCSFERCRFKIISFAGTAATLDQIRKGTGGALH